MDGYTPPPLVAVHTYDAGGVPVLRAVPASSSTGALVVVVVPPDAGHITCRGTSIDVGTLASFQRAAYVGAACSGESGGAPLLTILLAGTSSSLVLTYATRHERNGAFYELRAAFAATPSTASETIMGRTGSV
jgi:hypothetical protein